MGYNKPKFLVGVGATTGGLQAIQSFLSGISKPSGSTCIIAANLPDDFDHICSALGPLIKTPLMPIVDGQQLVPNRVYILEPGHNLTVKGNTLKVTSSPREKACSPLDTFFKSLATEWKNKACGVVLSGNGKDGIMGLSAIQRSGGFTVVQSPKSALFKNTPESAIKAKTAHAIDRPEVMFDIILDRFENRPANTQIGEIEKTKAALQKISEAVEGLSTIDATQYKGSMLERRVRKRMMVSQVKTLTEYAETVTKNPDEAKALGQTLLIGVTKFFRDKTAFKVIEQKVIPEIIQKARIEKRPVRIWTPGCATGQEAYTLALLLAKAIEELPYKMEVQIFATDIKQVFLKKAGQGTFRSADLESVPKDLREKYFDPIVGSETYLIHPDIRKMIIFASHDILSDPPFTRIDMISCRNLLIYFSLKAQQKIFSRFAFGLLKQGFLFLGSSENVGGFHEAFELIDAKNRIFRRTDFDPRRPSFKVPNENTVPESALVPLPLQTIQAKEAALRPAYNALLNEYAPDCLLLSDNRELLHIFGNARRFIRPLAGVTHLDAAEMVDKALKTPLVAGFERVLRDKVSINFSNIELQDYPKKGLLVNIEIRPLIVDSGQISVLALINECEDRLSTPALSNTTLTAGAALNHERIETLEAELHRTRVALQSTIKRIETTNEELQSSNEEFISSNEELQSTNEELSSINEELYSVNAEYHRQNDELSQLNTDFDLLLQSTQIGVIFLDKAARITKFTALAQTLFKLTEADIGRSIATFRSPFTGVEPEVMIEQAFDSREIIETEAEDAEGTAWLIRSVAHENQQGSVLTIINIGRLRDAEIDVRKKSEMLSVMQNMMNAFYFEMAPDIRTITTEIGLVNFLGRSEGNRRDTIDFSTIHPEDRPLLESKIIEARTAPNVKFICRMFYAPDDDYRYIQFYAERMVDDSWKVSGFDVHGYLSTQNQLSNRQSILDAILEASPSLVSYVDQNQRYVYVNREYLENFGAITDDVVGMKVEDFLPEDLFAKVKPHMNNVLRDGKKQSFMMDNTNANGKKQRFSVVYEPVFNALGEPMGFVTDVLDVSKYYENAEQAGRLDSLLSTVAKNSSYGLFVVDVKTLTLEYANPNGLTRMGLPRSSTLPKGLKITRLTPTWGEKTWSEWLLSKTAGVDLIRFDVLVFGNDDESSHADIYAGLTIDQGRSKAIVRIFENKERSNMFHDLQARTRELARSNRDLEQFASVVAHDLSAPLRHITQFSEMIEEEIGEHKSKSTQDYLTIIKNSAGKMSDMVAGLLKYSRLGLSTPDFEPVDLKKCIALAENLLSTDIDRANAKIIVTGSPDAFGDSDLLCRLFQNMIQNSIKYAQSDLAPVISIQAEHTEKDTHIRITDNGIGIPKKHSASIFKLFQRLHNSKKYQGLGVGLATCQRIMELHGGSIALDENWTDGARFIVKLPRRN